ncbi:hypothetical protein JM83_1059 [Gillisia sp. Hel_I_86]|nr:hypothetical protein JM83_1059 [Gillisia sp. Hel_I_86]
MGDFSHIFKISIHLYYCELSSASPIIIALPYLLAFHTRRDDSLIRIAEFLFLVSSIAVVVFIMLKVTG